MCWFMYACLLRKFQFFPLAQERAGMLGGQATRFNCAGHSTATTDSDKIMEGETAKWHRSTVVITTGPPFSSATRDCLLASCGCAGKAEAQQSLCHYLPLADGFDRLLLGAFCC